LKGTPEDAAQAATEEISPAAASVADAACPEAGAVKGGVTAATAGEPALG